MSSTLVPCPPVGHKQFQSSLKFIELGEVQKPQQISKFIRPFSCTDDSSLGIEYRPGELQRTDLALVQFLFDCPHFIFKTFRENETLFRDSECRIYQFQTIPRTGPIFVFGTIITDEKHNLIDFGLDTYRADKRRVILHKLIRAICTPQSVAKKIHH